MSRKARNFILLIVIICIGYTVYYFNQYHIKDNKASIQSNLSEWLNRIPGQEMKLTVIQVTN